MKLSQKIIRVSLVCIFIISISIPAARAKNDISTPDAGEGNDISTPAATAEDNISTSAAENDHVLTDGLFIITEEVPAEAIKYMREHIAGICNGLYPLDMVTVGEPFVVKGHDTDLYYFLIYSNGELVTSYRVFQIENGGYSGILDESELPQFLDGFKELMDITTSRSPAKIVVGEYEDMYAVAGDKILTILEDYAGRITDDNYILQKSNAACKRNESVIDAAKEINFNH